MKAISSFRPRLYFIAKLILLLPVAVFAASVSTRPQAVVAPSAAVATSNLIQGQMSAVKQLVGLISMLMAEIKNHKAKQPKRPDTTGMSQEEANRLMQQFQDKMHQWQSKLETLSEKLTAAQAKLAKEEAALRKLQSQLSTAQQQDRNAAQKRMEQERRSLEQQAKPVPKKSISNLTAEVSRLLKKSEKKRSQANALLKTLGGTRLYRTQRLKP